MDPAVASAAAVDKVATGVLASWVTRLLLVRLLHAVSRLSPPLRAGAPWTGMVCSGRPLSWSHWSETWLAADVVNCQLARCWQLQLLQLRAPDNLTPPSLSMRGHALRPATCTIILPWTDG